MPDNPIHIRGEPAALNTIFGFVIFGKVPASNKVSPCMSPSYLIYTPPTDEMLQHFWESEEPNVLKTKSYFLRLQYDITTVDINFPSFKKDFSQAK